jgi:hypothetical protein
MAFSDAFFALSVALSIAALVTLLLQRPVAVSLAAAH